MCPHVPCSCIPVHLEHPSIHSELTDNTSPMRPLKSHVMKPGAWKGVVTHSKRVERNKTPDSVVCVCVCVCAYVHVCLCVYCACTPVHLEHLSRHSELADDTSPVRHLQSRVVKPRASKRVTTHSKRAVREKTPDLGVCVCVCVCDMHVSI